MMKPVLRTFALCVLLVAVAGCRVEQVMTVENAALNPPASATDDEISKAIRLAGTTLGWQMIQQAPGQIEGTLRLRRHDAVVNVAYDRKAFSIRYKNSTNLNYNASDGTIHSNYNGWVTNLKNAIQANVAAI
ncbi:MAG: hypothetical protein GEU92_00410 [Alphaproteobacteria bacterium]|nr:hypothetical protein [Alphaproteobacteria bacterium]